MIEVAASGMQRYQLVRRLGQGSFGRVHEAIDRESGQRIALKELTAVNAVTLAHFKHEFRTVQEVHHPNLVRLDALFEDQGKWMIAMELVEGIDLLDYIYIEATERHFDEHRLREVFLQLAEGLMALHAAGVVHCDIKPNNILITREDRVVLLDFGLATAIDISLQAFRDVGIGTLSYMAPEQISEAKVGAAADWYAFGVCLFQALTGLLPIDAATAHALVIEKQRSAAPRASSVALGIPDDLDELCASLLQIAPEARPSGRAVRAVLGGTLSLPWLSGKAGSVKPVSAGTGFEGRAQELAAIERALQQVEDGALQVVLVEGESGIGKSALVEHFIAEQRGALVLRSRCYESELLAFKAFDHASYELANHLCRVSQTERQALMSERPGLLRLLFPALEIVDTIANAPLSPGAAAPAQQRFEAFATFGRLLERLGRARTLIFVIDDLQWADAESFALLQSLLAIHGLRCLILGTVRPAAELEGEARRGIAALRALGCVRNLRLSGLPKDSARLLVRRSIRSEVPQAWLEAIVDESGGHPLFLSVLARFAGGHDPRLHEAITLDLALAAQLGGLTRRARRLVDAVAIAGAPIAIGTSGRAAGVSEADLGPIITELCQKKLLRRRRAGQIACFHDRVRHVAVSCLPPEESSKLHGKLAAALATQANVDPAELARHLEGAGEAGRAQQAYQRAAERALSSLAFSRAAWLYLRALELLRTLDVPAAERRPLHIARGHALARAGRSAEAAVEYLEAAHRAPGEQRTQLRILAAQHLLQSACVQEGVAAAHELLAELGLPVPSDSISARARSLLERMIVRVSRLQQPAVAAPLGDRERMQLDALWGLSLPIAWLDTVQGAALSTQHLRLAHDCCAPSHMARALAEEAFLREFEHPQRASVDLLLGRARMLCDSLQDAELDVRVAYREGSIAAMRWEVPYALSRLQHAHAVATERCPDQPWLLTQVRLALGPLWFAIGEHRRLASTLSGWIDEARDRNDRFALSLLEHVGAGHLRHLMDDDPERALAVLAAVATPWPRTPFSLVHFGETMASMDGELYRGGELALRWFEEQQPRLARARLLQTRFGKAHALSWHALACIAACAGSASGRTRQLLARAARSTEELARLSSPLSTLNAALLRAQVLALRGDERATLPQIEVALRAAQQAQHQPFEHALGQLQGAIEGGAAGRELRARSLAFFAEQGWKAPHKAAWMVCPALAVLEQSSTPR